MYDEINKRTMYFRKIKKTTKENWKPFVIGVAVTTITIVVTKRVSLRYMHINGTNTFISKTIVKDGGLYKVFNIYSPGFKHLGPSWMVKCIETGKLFRSQDHAAKVMGLSKGHISMHLNGARSSVGGYHFVRLGIGA